jgi:hypothetical protein
MIPAMTASMVLPPFTGESAVDRASTAPYETSMGELVERFGISAERVVILRGLLSFRRRLLGLGIDQGWQWVDGSFVEEVEQTRGRPPADVDVVTFFKYDGDNDAKRDLVMSNEDLFWPARAKHLYKCDAYFVDLGSSPELLVDDTRYWFGLFSHQRATNLWKGMLKIALRSDDDVAEARLDQMERELGGEDNAQEA